MVHEEGYVHPSCQTDTVTTLTYNSITTANLPEDLSENSCSDKTTNTVSSQTQITSFIEDTDHAVGCCGLRRKKRINFLIKNEKKVKKETPVTDPGKREWRWFRRDHTKFLPLKLHEDTLSTTSTLKDESVNPLDHDESTEDSLSDREEGMPVVEQCGCNQECNNELLFSHECGYVAYTGMIADQTLQFEPPDIHYVHAHSTPVEVPLPASTIQPISQTCYYPGTISQPMLGSNQPTSTYHPEPVSELIKFYQPDLPAQAETIRFPATPAEPTFNVQTNICTDKQTTFNVQTNKYTGPLEYPQIINFDISTLVYTAHTVSTDVQETFGSAQIIDLPSIDSDPKEQSLDNVIDDNDVTRQTVNTHVIHGNNVTRHTVNPLLIHDEVTKPTTSGGCCKVRHPSSESENDIISASEAELLDRSECALLNSSVVRGSGSPLLNSSVVRGSGSPFTGGLVAASRRTPVHRNCMFCKSADCTHCKRQVQVRTRQRFRIVPRVT